MHCFLSVVFYRFLMKEEGTEFGTLFLCYLIRFSYFCTLNNKIYV
jgi:hypothetical protein